MTKPAPDRPERTWTVALVLTALAFLHRWFFFQSNEDATWAFSIFYEGDAEVFHTYAQAIRAGRSYDGGVPFHPPAFRFCYRSSTRLPGPRAGTHP